MTPANWYKKKSCIKNTESKTTNIGNAVLTKCIHALFLRENNILFLFNYTTGDTSTCVQPIVVLKSNFEGLVKKITPRTKILTFIKSILLQKNVGRGLSQYVLLHPHNYPLYRCALNEISSLLCPYEVHMPADLRGRKKIRTIVMKLMYFGLSLR